MFYSKSSQKILALWKVENWRGLNSEKETIRTARYLKDKQHKRCNTKDFLTSNKSIEVPIIKNGSMELHAKNLNKKTYKLQNTCAFDSLLQLILVTISDNQHFENKVNCLYFFSNIYLHT